MLLHRFSWNQIKSPGSLTFIAIHDFICDSLPMASVVRKKSQQYDASLEIKHQQAITITKDMMGCMHVSEWVEEEGCPGRIKQMPLGKRTGGSWIRADLWQFGMAAHLQNHPVIIYSPVSGAQSYCREMQRPPNGSVSSHTLRHGESTSDLQNVFFYYY